MPWLAPLLYAARLTPAMPRRVAHAMGRQRQAKSREPETASNAGAPGWVSWRHRFPCGAPALVCADDELPRNDRCREPPAFLPWFPLRVPSTDAGWRRWRAPDRQLPQHRRMLFFLRLPGPHVRVRAAGNADITASSDVRRCADRTAGAALFHDGMGGDGSRARSSCACRARSPSNMAAPDEAVRRWHFAPA
jgi:hypothetical protein